MNRSLHHICAACTSGVISPPPEHDHEQGARKGCCWCARPAEGEEFRVYPAWLEDGPR